MSALDPIRADGKPLHSLERSLAFGLRTSVCSTTLSSHMCHCLWLHHPWSLQPSGMDTVTGSTFMGKDPRA